MKSLSPEGDDRDFVKNKMNDFIIKNEHFLRAITCIETLLLVISSTAMVAIGVAARNRKQSDSQSAQILAHISCN